MTHSSTEMSLLTQWNTDIIILTHLGTGTINNWEICTDTIGNWHSKVLILVKCKSGINEKGKLEKWISEFIFFNLILFEKVENWKSRKVKKVDKYDGWTKRQTDRQIDIQQDSWMDGLTERLTD